MSTRRSGPRKPSDVCVTILGAGVTGLSAAHELIERGFRVQVIEKAGSPPFRYSTSLSDDDLRSPLHRLDKVDVGGIARTQWSTVPEREVPMDPEAREDSPTADTVLLRPVQTADEWLLGVDGGFPFLSPSDRDFLAVKFDIESGEPIDLESDWNAWIENGDHADHFFQLVSIAYELDRSEGPLVRLEGIRSAYCRLAAVSSFWSDWARSSKEGKELRFLPPARLDYKFDKGAQWEFQNELVRTGGSFPGVLIRRHSDKELVPGEHGFRFFPGFYRHLHDTMERTPIWDPDSLQPTHRTVYDNLREVRWQVVADPSLRHPVAFRRKPSKTLAETVEHLRSVRKQLGYRQSDTLRFALRMARYMTSSTIRRSHCYERLSWWDFLCLRDLQSNPKTLLSPQTREHSETRDVLPYGRRFKRMLKHAPKALVAMASEVTDARTQGNVSVQLAMDQFNLHDRTDSTLNGPTSQVWFEPWRLHLERLGVKFFVGDVLAFRVRGPKSAVEVLVQRPTRTMRPGDADEVPEQEWVSSLLDQERPEDDCSKHYVVCALDAVSLHKVLQRSSLDPPDHLARAEQPTRHEAKPSGAAHSAASPPHRGYDADIVGKIAELVEYENAESRGERDPESLRRKLSNEDRFQTLTGAQFYFEHRLSFADAHIYYAESPFDLSAISQIQHWMRFRAMNGAIGSERTGKSVRIRGNLSLDIGSWRAERLPMYLMRLWSPGGRIQGPEVRFGHGHPPDTSPSMLTHAQIAHGIAHQVLWCAGRDGDPDMATFRPTYFHLDDYIQFTHRQVGDDRLFLPAWNRAPYLINLVSDWNNRPMGEPWSPNHASNRHRRAWLGGYVLSGGEYAPGRPWVPHIKGDPRSAQYDGRAVERHRESFGYWIYQDSLVFAGPHMRTFTRLGTMESANESARHAVNSILDHLHANYRPGLPRFVQGSTVSLDSTEGPIGSEDLRVSELGTVEGRHHYHERAALNLDVGNSKSGPYVPATSFGDYCRIWDPEEHEFADLEFLRRVDAHLFDSTRVEEGREEDFDGDDDADAPECLPHIFDILELDKLPDAIDAGADADVVFKATYAVLNELQSAGSTDSFKFLRGLASLSRHLDSLTRGVPGES